MFRIYGFQNFGIDHCFSSYSTIHEDCKYLTAIIDQSVCNGLNLAPILMETEPIVDQMEIPVRKLPFAKRVNVIVTSVSSPSDFHVCKSFCVPSFRCHFEFINYEVSISVPLLKRRWHNEQLEKIPQHCTVQL